jgi:hypothetical protein
MQTNDAGHFRVVLLSLRNVWTGRKNNLSTALNAAFGKEPLVGALLPTLLLQQVCVLPRPSLRVFVTYKLSGRILLATPRLAHRLPFSIPAYHNGWRVLYIVVESPRCHATYIILFL